MWRSQSPWPDLRSKLYDWYLAPTAGLYGAKRALVRAGARAVLDRARGVHGVVRGTNCSSVSAKASGAQGVQAECVCISTCILHSMSADDARARACAAAVARAARPARHAARCALWRCLCTPTCACISSVCFCLRAGSPALHASSTVCAHMFQRSPVLCGALMDACSGSRRASCASVASLCGQRAKPSRGTVTRAARHPRCHGVHYSPRRHGCWSHAPGCYVRTVAACTVRLRLMPLCGLAGAAQGHAVDDASSGAGTVASVGAQHQLA